MSLPLTEGAGSLVWREKTFLYLARILDSKHSDEFLICFIFGLIAIAVFSGSAIAVTEAEIANLKSRMQNMEALSESDLILASQINDNTGSYIDLREAERLFKEGGGAPTTRPRHPHPTLDEYIWTEIDSEWIDIEGLGTSCGITNDDQNAGPFDIGFSFPFYDNSYTSIRVCSNGWASFTSTSTSYFEGTIPSAEEPNNALYPFWDDMYPQYG